MRDLRDSVRALRANPLVSAVAVLSLALGIGANTALFSILNGLLLKSLPVRDPHRLVALGSTGPDGVSVTYAAWREIRDRRLLGGGFAWAADRAQMVDAGEPIPLETIWATGAFFDTLGVSAVRGRTFGEADDRRGGGPDGPVAVISHGLWQRRFGGAPDAIGRTLTIERVPFTIVGVAPPGFFGLSVGVSFDVALPLETEPLLGRAPARLDSPYWNWLEVMGRLGPGDTLESAAAVLQRAHPEVRQATMPDYGRAEDRARYLRSPWTAKPGGAGSSGLRSRYGPVLVTLLATSGLVLLVACANIGNLLLARTAARRHEFTVRRAVGASRAALARQLLVESLVLAGIGAAIGFVFAQWGAWILVELFTTWASTPFIDLSPDWRVLAVSAAVTVATAVLFGTAPAHRGARVEPIEVLKQHTRGSDDTGKGIGAALVVVQIAVSLVLVVGAGLFLQSFAALAYRDLGLERGRVVVAIVNARRSAVPPEGRVALYERMRDAAAAVPGADVAAASLATPLGSLGNVRQTPLIQVPGSAVSGEPVRLLTNAVTPGWFRTFGTRMLAGRDFDARDRRGAQRVAIVNQAFARRYFDNATPLGRTIVQENDPDDRRNLEIVGLVEDAAFTSVRDSVAPTIYTAFAQGVDEKILGSFPFINISVRAAQGAPERLTRGLAAAIEGVDRDVSVSFLTLTQHLDIFVIRERMLALLSGFFGGLALLLAALGLYGMTAHAVSRRRTEIGIRMALGADARRVVRLVLGRVAWLAALGVCAGALASFWAARFVRTLLFQLEARDPLTFVAAALVLLAVAGLAGWLPARRAARLDPATVLRDV